VNLPVTLNWTDVPNPQPSGYVLEVAKDSGFSNIEYSNNQITGPSWTITSLTSGTKFWRVLSTQGDSAPGVPANTAWSATRSFIIPSTPPAVGSLTLANTSPSNGDTETFWIQLTTPAPAGGAIINMTSSNPTAAPVPATVSIVEPFVLSGTIHGVSLTGSQSIDVDLRASGVLSASFLALGPGLFELSGLRYDVTTVPEPASALLVGTGITALGWRRGRRWIKAR